MSDGYRAVVFDFFGTLTSAVTRGPAHARVAEILGCDPRRFVDMLNRSYRARLRGEYGTSSAALCRIATELGQRPEPAAVAAAARVRREAIGADITLRAGAVWTLWTIRARGLRTALVTDCTDELPELVAALPIAAHLDATVYSVELGVAKPDPAMFLTASRRLGVAPEQCLYVGDGGGCELTGARRAGMTAVRLAAHDLTEHLTYDPEPAWDGATVADVRDVPGLVLPGLVRPNLARPSPTRPSPAQPSPAQPSPARSTGRYWADEQARDGLGSRAARQDTGHGEFVDAGRG